MRRVKFVVLFVCSVLTIHAQDIIYKTNGDSIVAKVLGSKHGNLEYASYKQETAYIQSIPINEVSSISYANAPMNSFTVPKISIQETSSAPANALLTRKGNHYYYNGVKMNQREYGDFLAMNSQPAYQRFQNGYRMSNYGWALFGAGCVAELSSLFAFMRVWNSYHDYYGPSYVEIYSSHPGLGWGLVFVGSVLQIVSIPMISSGYALMHNSVDIYNVEKIKKYQPTLSVKGGANGIGVALNF